MKHIGPKRPDPPVRIQANDKTPPVTGITLITAGDNDPKLCHSTRCHAGTPTPRSRGHRKLIARSGQPPMV